MINHSNIFEMYVLQHMCKKQFLHLHWSVNIIKTIKNLIEGDDGD